MRYQLLVWCETCLGDEDGCFGGERELFQSGRVFESPEEAQDAFYDWKGDMFYDFEIVPVEDID